jgi:hypothetical protein
MISRIWRYQLREDPDIDIGDMVETLESFPWPCEFHAAKILLGRETNALPRTPPGELGRW